MVLVWFVPIGPSISYSSFSFLCSSVSRQLNAECNCTQLHVNTNSLTVTLCVYRMNIAFNSHLITITTAKRRNIEKQKVHCLIEKVDNYLIQIAKLPYQIGSSSLFGLHWHRLIFLFKFFFISSDPYIMTDVHVCE